jgi:hypothetical protein
VPTKNAGTNGRCRRCILLVGIGHLIFHGLVWPSFLVIAGVALALHRRLRDHGAAALQGYLEDLLPLFLLFAISVTRGCC